MSNVRNFLDGAQSAYSRGDLEAARQLLIEALKADPSNLTANVLMAAVLARTGNRADAIERLRKAIEIHADSFEAHVTLSTLLFADGRPDLAIRHGEIAIALRTQDPASYHHLARDLIAHRRPGQAIPYLRQALALAPGTPSLIQDLAIALGDSGEQDESIRLWADLTQAHPKVLGGWLRLGNLYLSGKRFKEAFECGRKAILLSPESPEARLLIGLALLGGDGGAREAEDHLKTAARLKPDGMAIQSAYGLALQEMGRFEEARPFFEKAIELAPAHGQSYYSLLRTRKTSESDRPLLDKLRRRLDDPAASVLDRSYMRYALGKAHEDFGEYEASMQNFDEATALAAQAWFAGRPSDLERYSSMIQATVETFTPPFLENPRRSRLESEKPLLVVGMIRSGTTLVEQILSSHPEVKGGGELPFWHEEGPKIWDLPNRKVDESGLKDAAEGYLALLNRLGRGHARVTDKLPHNYTMLGFVLAAIPNARVIYVKRHPVDNCLSIYTTAYQHPPALTLSRSNIVFSYREHTKIMDHWHDVPPSWPTLGGGL